MNVFSELKRRNVLRAGLAWLALSWLLIAIADLLFPYFGFPDEAIRALIVGLLICLLPVLVLAWLFELTPRGLRRDRGPTDDNPENVRTGRRIDQLTIVFILLALGMSAIRQFVLPEGVKPPAPEVQVITEYVQVPDPLPPAPPGPVDPRSLAVMPFANLSPDPANAFLAEGMAEELLNVLARLEGLKVASRTSSFSFRDSNVGGREIGRRLGVAHIVDGSLRRQGDSVRISAQLVRAEDDRQLWSASFDRELTDIFAVQEEIAQAIADALADTLGVRTVRVRQATTDLQAYELYLRGRQLFAQRGDSLMPARELMMQAVDRDPDFAGAWATLAGIEYVLPGYFSEAIAVETNRRALDAARIALRLEPDQPVALAVSARLAADEGDHLRALALIDRALESDPNNANTWMWKGLSLLEVGHIAAARACFEQALVLDPLGGINHGWLAATDVIAREVDSATANLDRASRLGYRGPASAWRLRLALDQRDVAAARARYVEWLREDRRIDPEHMELFESLAPLLGDPDRRDEASAKFSEAVAAWPESEWTLPLSLFGLNDQAAAEALRDKPVSGDLLLMMVWAPVHRALREHPDFWTLAEREGLIAFWDQQGYPDACRPVGDPPNRLECSK